MANYNFSELELLLKFEFEGNKENTLIDVGAHVGFFTKVFADKGWRVIAFEPEPENYGELCARYAHMSNVTCLQKAVSDNARQDVPFYISSEHWGIHSLTPFHRTHQEKIRVETVRLDEELARFSLGHITILKIDVEGADFFVLKGFDFDTYRPEVVLCEFMDSRSDAHYQYTHHDMANFMQQKGYCVYVSEWGPISEYSRKNGSPAEHQFIQCKPYPIEHDIAWGNLICVPARNAAMLGRILDEYLRSIKGGKFRRWVRCIPGSRHLYRFVKRLISGS